MPESWIVLADFSVSRIAGSTRLIYFSVIVILHNSSVSYQAGKTGNLVSQDKTQAVAALYQRLNKVNASWLRLKLEGLDPDAKYQVSCDLTPSSSFDTELAKRYGYDTVGNQVKTYEAYGDELMRAGIPVDRQDLNKKGGDFASLLYTIKKVD